MPDLPPPILYESHMHTPLCKHAIGEPEEYASVAYNRGLAGITVTCHNPLPNNHSLSVRMKQEQWPLYLACVARAKKTWAGKIDVRLGLECDYFPGLEPFLEKQIASEKFSHILGSVHPQTKEYIATYWKGDALAFQKIYFEHLALAAETKFFDTISHPDLVKNQTKDNWNLDRVMPGILRTLDRIAKTGTAMELNTSGVLKLIPEMNPGPQILAAIRDRNIPIVIGADAHEPARCGDRFMEALDMLKSLNFSHVSFFIDRKRREVDITEARDSLNF